jgi:hypothetical protein
VYEEFILEGVLHLVSGYIPENASYSETAYRVDIWRIILKLKLASPKLKRLGLRRERDE